VKTITGSFKLENDEPAAEGILSLWLSQDAKVISTRTEVKGDRKIEIQLDENGAIPAGTEILANDELRPAGTYYTIDVWHGNGGTFYRGWIKIVGPSPIDLTAIAFEESVTPGPEPDDTDEPEPRRAMPSPRKPGTNYIGFVGGVVHPPASSGTCTLPAIKESIGTFTGNAGIFGVFGFTLPFKSVVSRVSIIVDTPQSGNRVLVGLYDAGGNKVCATSIDASVSGVATGEFESAVNLSAGDYFLAWTAVISGVKAFSVGVDSNQFGLLNAAGGAVVLGTARIPDGTWVLPDKLGPISPSTSYLPILAYFKA